MRQHGLIIFGSYVYFVTLLFDSGPMLMFFRDLNAVVMSFDECVNIIGSLYLLSNRYELLQTTLGTSVPSYLLSLELASVSGAPVLGQYRFMDLLSGLM